MHRKPGKGSRKNGSSSERRLRNGFGLPFLGSSERDEHSSASQSSQVPGSSHTRRRSSFDRTRSARHRESRPVPMQDTSSSYSMESQSMADFRSHMSMSSSSKMASTPTDEESMSLGQRSSSSSMSITFPAVDPKKKKTGDVVCVKCGRTFHSMEEMQKHDSESHFKARTYECPVCHLTFRDQSNAMKHFRAVHEGKKLGVECSICRKAISGPESLMRHMKNIHANVRDISCPFCGARFKQASHMRKHVETQHSEELHGQHSRTGSSRRDSNAGRSSRASSSRGFF